MRQDLSGALPRVQERPETFFRLRPGELTAGAFAVWFSDIRKWSPASFRSAGWKWDASVIKPLSAAIERKSIPVDRRTEELLAEYFVTLRFGGAIEPREMDRDFDPKGSLFWAKAGDLIYSKIDCRNGA